jgi:hypothetical protein
LGSWALGLSIVWNLGLSYITCMQGCWARLLGKAACNGSMQWYNMAYAVSVPAALTPLWERQQNLNLSYPRATRGPEQLSARPAPREWLAATETKAEIYIIIWLSPLLLFVHSLSPPKPAGLDPPNFCRQTLYYVRKSLSIPQYLHYHSTCITAVLALAQYLHYCSTCITAVLAVLH